MAKVGAQRAAELTGKSKSTIQRAMNTGKISFEVDNAGRRVIDVSELERVFGVNQKSAVQQSNVEHELEKAKQMLESEKMRMQIKMLEEKLEAAQEHIDDLKGQRDKWQKQADQVLITSQYSQKQAEILQSQIEERERIAKERRQKRLEQQMLAQALNAQNENESSGSSSSDEGSDEVAGVASIKRFIKRVRG